MKSVATLAILLIAFASLADAQSCTIFTCGEITQPEEGDRVCSQKVPDSSDVTHHVEQCPEGNRCVAETWTHVANKTDTATCEAEPTTNVWPLTPQIEAGTALPGDFCWENKTCRNKNGKVTCENHVCVTTNAIGEVCSANEDCPAGAFCNKEDSKCAAIPAAGETCSADIPCAYNQVCAALEDSEFMTFTCFRRGGIEYGKKFVIATAPALPQLPESQLTEGADLQSSVYCDSTFAFVYDSDKNILECRTPPKNRKQGIKNLRKNNAGDECTVDIYNNPEDYTRKEALTTFAECGFNMDAHAYCPMMFGDSDIMDPFTKTGDNLFADDASCHSLSQGNCASFMGRFNGTDGLVFFRAMARVGNFPLIANNDECTGNTITSAYWRNRFGEGAMMPGFSSMIAIFALVLSISALF